MKQTIEGVPGVGAAADVRRAGVLLTSAGIGFLLVVTVLEAIYPDYSVHANTISDLLAIGTTTSLIGEPVLFLVAISWIAGAYYLFRAGRKRGLMILNMLPGTGLLLAVLSPENVNVSIHSIGAVLAFIPGAVAVIVSFRMIASPFRYFAAALGTVSLLGTIIEFGAYYSAIVQRTLGPGGWERIIVYPLLIWLMGFGGYLLGWKGVSR